MSYYLLKSGEIAIFHMHIGYILQLFESIAIPIYKLNSNYIPFRNIVFSDGRQLPSSSTVE